MVLLDTNYLTIRVGDSELIKKPGNERIDKILMCSMYKMHKILKYIYLFRLAKIVVFIFIQWV